MRPKKTMQLEFLAEWEHLLGSVNDDPQLAGMVTQPKLADVLNRTKAVLLKQAELTAAKQASTLELTDLFDEGKDVARDFKAELKARHGSRSEQLVRYKMLPLRKGTRAKKSSTPREGEAGKPVTPTSPIINPV
jgi:hypothetical protein